ncbi:hypothetical protein ABPG74_017391 [Tetrahymena malaccensis]
MDDNRRQQVLHNLRYYDRNINFQEEDEGEEGLEDLFQFKKKRKIQRFPPNLNWRIVEKLRLNEEQKILEAYEKQQEEKQNALKLMYLENQEDLFSSFDNNFYNNKSYFEHIWFQQEYNLKVCLNHIYKKFLQPKGINLSQAEKKILLSQLNTLVIGRSGTGKTTSALLRISAMDMSFNKYQEKYLQQPIPIKKLRICFTTISDYLKRDVHTTFRQITSQDQNVQIYDAHSLSQVKTWPLFTTVRNLINMIDGNLAIPFLKRDTNGRIISDLGYQNDNYVRSKIKAGSEVYQEIGISQFINEFWQEHKQIVEILNVDYYTVYSQINSYITGHINSFLSHNGMITLEQYINTIGRTKNYLDNEKKENIYKICQLYQKWKISKKYFDLNDQVIYILQQIFENKYFSEEGFFHYIFIDEVQDLNCLIIYLLTIITEQNIFMGGDTAQTISQEIAFRFTELKAFFQKKFMIEDLACTLVLQQQLVEEQLLKNFRCHQQITVINNTLIKLLELLFPTCIDILEHESSEKEGPKPLLLHDFDILKKFLFQDIKLSEKDQKEDSSIKKSSHFGICDRFQAFLVKNDQEKEKLQKFLDQDDQLSNFQVYTIFESKGLEFQDVITYNLLNISFKATGCWAVLNHLSEKLEKTQQLEFHIQKAYGKEFPKLIPEIKNLYVAFSRARSRLFIFEDLDEQQKTFKNPISIFFEKHRLFEENTISKEQQKLILECHKSYIVYNEPKVNPDQFLQQAKILFEKKQYKYAGDLFKRLGDYNNFYLCHAKIIADNANKLIAQNRQKFESEKQIYIKNNQICENQIQIYKEVKKVFQESMYYLEKIDNFKMISQIQFTLGEYQLAIQANKNRIQQIQKNNDIQFEERDMIIKEVNREIKIFYLNLLLVLEEKFQSTQNEIQKQKKKDLYKELDLFLESFPLIDIELVLFAQYHCQDYNRLYISIQETYFAFDDKQLKKNINYYYPCLLKNELNVYYDFYQPCRTVTIQENAQFLTSQYKKFIHPFQDVFQQIILARMSKEFLENLSKDFEQQNYCFSQQNISSNQFLIFFLICGHFNQYEIQLQISRYFNNLKLQQLSIANFAFQNYKCSERINNFLDKIIIDQKFFIKNQSQNVTLNHLSFLGLHDKLIKRNIETYSDRFLFSLNYFKLSKSYPKKITYHYLIDFQTFVNSKYKSFEELKNSHQKIYGSEQNSKNYQQIYDYVLMSENLKQIRKNAGQKVLQIPEYQKNFNYDLQQYKQIKEKRYIAKLKIREIKHKCFNKYQQKDFINIFLSSVEELQVITAEKYSNNEGFMIFFEYQKLLFKFYFGMKIISLTNCFIDFNTNQIESITSLASFIINYNNSIQSQKILGENNKLFLDALCSIFGYVCPNSSRFETTVENELNIWDNYNISDFYFVDSKSEFYQQDQQIVDLFAFFPIISDDNTQAVYRQKVILVCKKRIAEVLKDFIVGYSQYIVYKIKQSSKTKNYEENLKLLNQSIQILYLENELKILLKSQFSYIINKQVENIKKQNQLNDEQAEEAFNIYFKNVFKIDNHELKMLKQIVIKNGIFLQFNTNIQQTIQVGEQNKLDAFFIHQFLDFVKKLENQIKNIEENQQKEMNAINYNKNQNDDQIIDEEEANPVVNNYNHNEIFEEGQESDEDDQEDLQNQIYINQKISEKKDDLFGQYQEEFIFLFSVIQIRQLTPAIPSILNFKEMKQDSHLPLTILKFFNSKWENNYINISLNSLELVDHIKGGNWRIRYLLLITGLNEFIKYITNEDIQSIDILEEQIEYFDIQENKIIINKKNVDQDIQQKLCYQYLVNIFNCVQNIEIPSFKLFVIKNIIVYAALQALKNLYLLNNKFLEDFSQFLKQMINYNEFKKKIKFYKYDQVETKYQIYQESLHKFRDRYFNTLIYLLDNKYKNRLQIFLQNTQQHHLQSLYFLRNKKYQIAIKYLENTQDENNFLQKTEVSQIIQEYKNLNVNEEQNNQITKTYNKAYQRYDFIGYIHQKLNNQAQIYRICDLIQGDDTLKDLFTKVIKILQKSRKQILNKITKEEINSSEQFIFALEKLEALGNQEKVLITKIVELLKKEANGINKQHLILLLQDQMSKLKKIVEELNMFQTQKVQLEILDSIMFIRQQLINLN